MTYNILEIAFISVINDTPGSTDTDDTAIRTLVAENGIPEKTIPLVTAFAEAMQGMLSDRINTAKEMFKDLKTPGSRNPTMLLLKNTLEKYETEMSELVLNEEVFYQYEDVAQDLYESATRNILEQYELSRTILQNVAPCTDSDQACNLYYLARQYDRKLRAV